MTSVRPVLPAEPSLDDAATAAAPLRVRHEPWVEPLTRPAMSNEVDPHARVSLTNRYVERDGQPVIPVTGELHFSRIPRDQWDERLRLMRAGGITAVASYVLWNHHQPTPDAPSFDGALDVAAFVRTAEAAGLDVVLRIGPWVHAESRNGGFPDWVQRAPVAHRTDDPAYLALVEPWFAALAAEVAPLCGPASSVIAIQLENELYEEPQHLVTLKAMARRLGMTAPIYTATAWGGADLPVGEVLPLYGGYGDGFWVDADHDWDTTFREHFFFSHTWDDPGIGADLRDHPGVGHVGETPRLPSASFPAATCELGGGMATAYHRRPLLSGADIAAVAHDKIGNGSGWQGYYMYAGGVNPGRSLQESHGCGYPNDLPEFDYDFHAPIGSAGLLGPAHAPLRRQHAFLEAFGPALAPMPSTLPERMPTGVDDADTLRWALRSDGSSGWLFVTWQQPHVPLGTVKDVRFCVDLDGERMLLPSGAIDVPAGTIAHWPLGLELAGVRIDWLTASPLTVLPGAGAVPTLVVVAEAGIPVELSTSAEVSAGAALDTVAPGVVRVEGAAELSLASATGALRVLVLPASVADRVWVLGTGDARRLLLAGDEATALFTDADGRLAVRGDASVEEYSTAARAFLPLSLAGRQGSSVPVETSAPAPGSGCVPDSFGRHHGRASAPDAAAVTAYATNWTLAIPARGDARRHLEIDWAGDVARLEVDGVVVADRFWDGTRWFVSLDDLGLTDAATLTLRILPLSPAADVHLPEGAAARRSATGGQLIALDGVRLVETPLRREAV